MNNFFKDASLKLYSDFEVNLIYQLNFCNGLKHWFKFLKKECISYPRIDLILLWKKNYAIK